MSSSSSTLTVVCRLECGLDVRAAEVDREHAVRRAFARQAECRLFHRDSFRSGRRTRSTNQVTPATTPIFPPVAHICNGCCNTGCLGGRRPGGTLRPRWLETCPERSSSSVWTARRGICSARSPSAASCRTWRGRWSGAVTAVWSRACRRTAPRHGCRSRPARARGRTASSTSGRPERPARSGWCHRARRAAPSCGIWSTPRARWRTWSPCRCPSRRPGWSTAGSCAGCSLPARTSTTPGRRS